MWRETIPRPVRLGIIAVAVLGMIFIAGDLVGRLRAPRSRVAQAIIAGEVASRTNAKMEAEDQNISDDEADAGAMWARSHRPENAGGCPNYSRAFVEGCADYVGARAYPRTGAVDGLDTGRKRPHT